MLVLDEVDVVNGLDVVDFSTVLDVQGVVGDVLCILLSEDLQLDVGLFCELCCMLSIMMSMLILNSLDDVHTDAVDDLEVI